METLNIPLKIDFSSIQENDLIKGCARGHFSKKNSGKNAESKKEKEDVKTKVIAHRP